MPSEGRVYEDSTEKPYVSGDGSTTSVSPCALQAATEDASLRPSSPQREMQNSSAHAPDVSMPTPPATCIPSASITTSSSLLSHELRVTIPERPNVSIGERTRELSPSFFHHDLRMHVISLEGLSAQETELVMKDLWALRDAGSISVAADAHSPYLLHVQWVSVLHHTIAGYIERDLYKNRLAIDNLYQPTFPLDVEYLRNISVPFYGNQEVQADGGFCGRSLQELSSPFFFIEIALTQSYSAKLIKCAKLLNYRASEAANLVILVRTFFRRGPGAKISKHAWGIILFGNPVSGVAMIKI
ncbi:hypothetical protein SISSUDRAFT_752201 [Sistotremastrum suecicum HHB10207 ss-3]|uniref:Uncharacterized protein n=1 Tax=Sistotremastrum suecicum HHB10207 ss-3 TaxID=1314776 RepID=A0A166DE04_9AGAM|nr:hypothetical protein SISSUDRAFT_752201 [Sistotremastrum suecicum HHB10207 ss-3]